MPEDIEPKPDPKPKPPPTPNETKAQLEIEIKAAAATGLSKDFEDITAKEFEAVDRINNNAEAQSVYYRILFELKAAEYQVKIVNEMKSRFAQWETDGFPSNEVVIHGRVDIGLSLEYG